MLAIAKFTTAKPLQHFAQTFTHTAVWFFSLLTPIVFALDLLVLLMFFTVQP